MRVLIGLMAAAAALSTLPAAARQSAAKRPVARPRSVQLIPMIASVPAAPGPAEQRADTLEAAPLAGALTPGFALHDLSRRWVEYQMQASLASPPAATGPARIRDDDPFAPQARATTPLAGPAPFPPPPAAIAVPGWMLGVGIGRTGQGGFLPGCDANAAYRPSGFLGLGSEARRQAYYGMMSTIACQYGIPVGLFDAMIIRESRYDPAIVSPKNAYGLTQLMPATAVGLGVDRYDVEQNLRGGARFLRQQLDRFGQVHLALAAYNAGPGRVHGSVPQIAETQGYVADILDKWARLSGSRSLTAAPVRSVGRPTIAARPPGATMLLF